MLFTVAKTSDPQNLKFLWVNYLKKCRYELSSFDFLIPSVPSTFTTFALLKITLYKKIYTAKDHLGKNQNK